MVNGPTLGSGGGSIYATVRNRIQASTGRRASNKDVANETNRLLKLNNVSQSEARRLTPERLASLRTSNGPAGGGGRAV